MADGRQSAVVLRPGPAGGGGALPGRALKTRLHLQPHMGLHLHHVRATLASRAGKQRVQAAVKQVGKRPPHQRGPGLAQQACGHPVGAAHPAVQGHRQQALQRCAHQLGARVESHQQAVGRRLEQAVFDRRCSVHHQREDVERRHVVVGRDVECAQPLSGGRIDGCGDTKIGPHAAEKMRLPAHQIRQTVGDGDGRRGRAHTVLGHVHPLAAAGQQHGGCAGLMAQPVDHHASAVEQQHRAAGATHGVGQALGFGPGRPHQRTMHIVQAGQQGPGDQLKVDLFGLVHAGIHAALPRAQQRRFIVAWLQPGRHPVVAAHTLQAGFVK